MSQKTYSNIETGSSKPTVETLEKICSIFEVNLLDLLAFDEKQLFSGNQNISNSFIVGSQVGENEKILYEKIMTQHQEEIIFLRNELKRLNQIIDQMLQR